MNEINIFIKSSNAKKQSCRSSALSHFIDPIRKQSIEILLSGSSFLDFSRERVEQVLVGIRSNQIGEREGRADGKDEHADGDVAFRPEEELVAEEKEKEAEEEVFVDHH